MKKHLAILVAVSMVLSMLTTFMPGGTALADGTAANGIRTRRALIIGNANYAQSGLLGPTYDAKHMQALFKQMDFGTGGSPAEQGAMDPNNIKMLTDQTKSQIKQDIITYLQNNADDDDVSYFYYSGHGSVSDGEAQIVGVDLNFVSLTELKSWLDSVHGTKVVILDSCFSGGFIDKSESSGSSAKSSAAKGPTFVLPGHNRPGTVATPRASGLNKLKPAQSSASTFPTALLQQPPEMVSSQAAQFKNSVKATFSRTSKYLSGNKYIVLTASSQNEYSYEYGFNTMYGPDFIMNGVNIAEPNSADSGEFSGMLVAGAGKVTFSTDYGETGLLADYNGDGKITDRELYHFLQGALICSDVSLYSDYSTGTVIFSHDPASTDVPKAMHVKLEGSVDADGIPSDVTSGKDSTGVKIDLDLSGLSADEKKQLVICQNPKMTDGTGANGSVSQTVLKTFDLSANPSSVTWDGKDDNGNPVPDGTYQIMLQYGEGRVQPSDPPICYPGVTVVLARGISVFDDANNEVSLSHTGSSYTSSGDIVIAKDGDITDKWFTAPATGAMNVYADTSRLDSSLTAVIELVDANGNVVDYAASTAMSQQIYMPFYVEKDRKYRLEFSILDNPDKAGDVGKYSCSMCLTTAIGVDTTVTGDGLGYEAWYLQPAASQNYIIQSTGADDTAAAIVDRNQVSVVGYDDDFNDQNFLISAPLVKDAGYLIVTKDNSAGPHPSFSFKVNSPGKLAAFSTAALPAITDPGEGYAADVANPSGATTYFKIHTGSSTEKWTFETMAGTDGTSLDEQNDPSLLLMDPNYNLIGANDDYNGDFAAEFSAVLKPGSTYILACRGSAANEYDYSLIAVKQVVTPADYVVSEPKVAIMDNSALSLDRYGTVSGWGYNEFGEVGNGTMDPSPSPSVVILPHLGKAVDLWAGEAAGFAKLTGGEYCWWGMSTGDGTPSGDGGDGSQPNTMAPAVLDCLNGLDIADIKYCAFEDALVRTYTGELYDLDVFDDVITPIDIPGEGVHSVVGIAATDTSYFALCGDGKLFAWGGNWSGECGTGDLGPVQNPTALSFGSGVQIRQVAAGWDHVLALDQNGKVYSWGYNMQGQNGQGDYVNLKKPALIAKSRFSGNAVSRIFAGANHSFGVDSAGNVYGWGANSYGELGLGNASKEPAPVNLPFYTALGGDNILRMSAGMLNVFAQDYSSHLYGYGGNLDYQLGNDGPSPDGGLPVELMTLAGNAAAHTTALKAIHVDNGTVSFNGKTITVSIKENSGSCMIVPEAVDPAATFTIGGLAVASKVISIPNPGAASASVAIAVSLPAKYAVAQTSYSLTVVRAKNANANLNDINVTSGADLSFNAKTGTCMITLPETMASVRLSPSPAGYAAHYVIDPNAATPSQDTPKTYTLALGATLTSQIKVTAQAGNTKTYNVTIKRPYMLTSLAAAPLSGGIPSLSPGGTNRMRILYSLSFTSIIKIEVKKGGNWITIASGLKGYQGANSWTWDGKATGTYLAAGTYSIRITPTDAYNDTVCTAKTLTVKILGKPYVSVPLLTPYTLQANGVNKLKFSVRWSVLSDVKVEIVNSSGTVVCTVYSAAGQARATRTLYWNGKNSAGALVPAGTYRVKVTAGGAAAVYRTFKVKR